jgi:hypothetical protein
MMERPQTVATLIGRFQGKWDLPAIAWAENI